MSTRQIISAIIAAFEDDTEFLCTVYEVIVSANISARARQQQNWRADTNELRCQRLWFLSQFQCSPAS
jgi:hypothetical protein